MDKKPSISIINDIPKPTDLEKHIVNNFILEEIWEWVKPNLLYNKLLGFKGNFFERLEGGDEKAIKLLSDVDEVKTIVKTLNNSLMRPKGIFQFFQCRSEGDSIHILDKNANQIIETMHFKRQSNSEYLCLSDFIKPVMDYFSFFVVTAGENVNEYAYKLATENRFKQSIILQALALATVEATAEYLHLLIRKFWNIKDDEKLTKKDIFHSKYRGLRYSFGYSSCPDLSYQKIIWDLLNPLEIGVSLTDEYMMDPEASVSAIVFHHPQAKYFTV